MVRVRATEVFPNCPRYIHQYRLVERSRFMPREGCPTPVPAWKTSDWSRDVFPPATRHSTRAPRSSSGGTMTIPTAARRGALAGGALC